MKKRTTCPECGSADVVEVVYGMPTPETFERADRGEVVLGGCCVHYGPNGELDYDDRTCRRCGCLFASRPPGRLVRVPLTVFPPPRSTRDSAT